MTTLKEVKEFGKGCGRLIYEDDDIKCGMKTTERTIYCQECKQKAKEILVGGCGERYGRRICGISIKYFCPTCQEIKQICERIVK